MAVQIGSNTARPNVQLDTSDIQALGQDRTTLNQQNLVEAQAIQRRRDIVDALSKMGDYNLRNRQLKMAEAAGWGTMQSSLARANAENEKTRVDAVADTNIREATADYERTLAETEAWRKTRTADFIAPIRIATDVAAAQTGQTAAEVTRDAISGVRQPLVEATGKGMVASAGMPATQQGAITASTTAQEMSNRAQDYSIGAYEREFPNGNGPSYEVWRAAKLAWAQQMPGMFQKQMADRAAAVAKPVSSLQGDNTPSYVKDIITKGGKQVTFNSADSSEWTGGMGELEAVVPAMSAYAKRYGMEPIVDETTLGKGQTAADWFRNAGAKRVVQKVDSFFSDATTHAVAAGITSGGTSRYTDRGMQYAVGKLREVYGTPTELVAGGKNGDEASLTFVPGALMPDQLETVVAHANAPASSIVELARASGGSVPEPSKLPPAVLAQMKASVDSAASKVGIPVDPTNPEYVMFAKKFAKSAYLLADAQTMSEREVGERTGAAIAGYESMASRFGELGPNSISARATGIDTSRPAPEIKPAATPAATSGSFRYRPAR